MNLDKMNKKVKKKEQDQMFRIDKGLLDTNEVICKNISQLSFSDRGFISQNILSQLRNFVEYTVIKIYSKEEVIDPDDYNLRKKALKYIRSRDDLQFLNRFHNFLQKSASHYTMDSEGSERLMLKYYACLLEIKHYLKRIFDLDVLQNIEEFPLNLDTELLDYYKKIAERIESPSGGYDLLHYNDRFYVQKVKPFFVNQKIYYEVTFTAANTNVSKFSRVIAFTRHEIIDNYAVRFSMHNDTIDLLDKRMSILVIDSYEISIRPCEWENFSKIFGPSVKYSTRSIEYRHLMNFLSNSKLSLTELVSSDQDYYEKVKRQIISDTKKYMIYELLDYCRDIIINEKPGVNILRYLLHKMNNRVIKSQFANRKCEYLSDLSLQFGCIPFDKMPYCTSLLQHNPKIYDLLDCIPVANHEHELFARYIKNNTEIKGHLFTPRDEIEGFENIDDLICKYNSSLYYKHIGRRIEEYKGNLYIKSYIDDSTKIIKKLQDLATSGVSQYTSSVDSWISREAYTIDDDSKKEALRDMFANSRVALIYGAAGTGKSTLLKHISNFLADQNKLFLANTHPAVDNMRRKVTVGKSEYSTIAKFLLMTKGKKAVDCDILFIDECSTVSNEDMRKILDSANFKLLVLVGDIYQIESIYFGNWFSIAKKFVPKTSIFELTNPYRTTNENLLLIWERVRNLDGAILEALVKKDYVATLDKSIFEHSEEDEVILCLNYDGLYGINNINRLLQENNPKNKVIWGIHTYKVGDPILFNESSIFSPLIHNNSKGRIIDIHREEQQIRFDIELDESINEIDAWKYEFDLIGESEAGKSIISFSVDKYRNTDEDDQTTDSTVIPFQVAYAVSIHKAQGLEYDSVKIIITNEIEERITHNIFYTAITRARKKLKIYWSPETEKSVLERFKVNQYTKDAELLSSLSSLPMTK